MPEKRHVDRDRCTSILAFAILCACLAATSSFAHAQQPAATPSASTPDQLRCRHPANPHRRQFGCNDQDFDWDETLAHRWNEVRAEMRRIGITPTASYMGVLQTNVTGGPHQVWSYAGQLNFGLSTDFSELLGIRGMSAYLGASWGTGSNLADTLNSSIPPNGLYAPSFYLGNLYVQQKFSSANLTLRAGRLTASSAFAALPVFNNYVDYGINPNPFSIGANDITFFAPPTGAEWGAQASFTITPAIEVTTGVFNTNLNSANGDSHGADFTLQQGNKGVLAIGEIDYLLNQRSNSHGKPGEFGIGFLHNNNSFPLLNNSASHSDGYSGVYVMGQQMISRPDGPGTSRGATVWGIWTHNTKDLVSIMPVFWGAGLSYEGLIPARKNDVASAGLVYGQASKFAPAASTEELLELNYQWTHSRYLTITPHVQFSWQRDGRPQNATVLGLQLALTF